MDFARDELVRHVRGPRRRSVCVWSKTALVRPHVEEQYASTYGIDSKNRLDCATYSQRAAASDPFCITTARLPYAHPPSSPPTCRTIPSQTTSGKNLCPLSLRRPNQRSSGHHARGSWPSGATPSRVPTGFGRRRGGNPRRGWEKSRSGGCVEFCPRANSQWEGSCCSCWPSSAGGGARATG